MLVSFPQCSAVFHLLYCLWEDESGQPEEVPWQPAETECHHNDEEHLDGLKWKGIEFKTHIYFIFLVNISRGSFFCGVNKSVTFHIENDSKSAG